MASFVLSSTTPSEAIPSSQEVEQVFKDFKRMLKVSRYQTPLRRANAILTRQKSIALSQKIQSETELVFNLLQPGHQTRLNVDFLRMLGDFEHNLYLRIPLTLLSKESGVLMIRTGPTGQVTCRAFTDIKSAFTVFDTEIAKIGVPKLYFPRYIHKSTKSVSTLYSTPESVLSAWVDFHPCPQRVQQFIQPHTKNRTLLRVHWKDSVKSSAFYCISSGPPPSQPRPNLVAYLSRSYSEASAGMMKPGVDRSSANLVVQRLKPICEVERAVQEGVRIVSMTVKHNQKVTEAVFDFVSDHQRQWVLISCEGFIFASKGKIVTQTIEQEVKIDLRFLMYPLIARRNALKRRLNRPRHLGNLNIHRKSREYDIIKKPEESTITLLSGTSPLAPLTPPTKAKAEPERPESVILSRDVLQYDALVQGSRLHRETLKNTVDMVQKYGGVDAWRVILGQTYKKVHETEEISSYFEERIGIEEHIMVVNGLIRVVKGDYNFYYKEALRRVHGKYGITKKHYDAFLGVIESMLDGVPMCPRDRYIVISRFQSLQAYICLVSSRFTTPLPAFSCQLLP